MNMKWFLLRGCGRVLLTDPESENAAINLFYNS